ncbi:hypothetical protein SLE2022_117440 [Rubroshorea leprosula]
MIAIKKTIKPLKEATELIEEDSKLLNKKMGQIRLAIAIVGQIRHRNLLPLLVHVGCLAKMNPLPSRSFACLALHYLMRSLYSLCIPQMMVATLHLRGLLFWATRKDSLMQCMGFQRLTKKYM